MKKWNKFISTVKFFQFLKTLSPVHFTTTDSIRWHSTCCSFSDVLSTVWHSIMMSPFGWYSMNGVWVVIPWALFVCVVYDIFLCTWLIFLEWSSLDGLRLDGPTIMVFRTVVFNLRKNLSQIHAIHPPAVFLFVFLCVSWSSTLFYSRLFSIELVFNSEDGCSQLLRTGVCNCYLSVSSRQAIGI